MVSVYVVKLWFSSLLANVIWCSCGLLMVQHMLTTLYHGQLLWFSVCWPNCLGFKQASDVAQLLAA